MILVHRLVILSNSDALSVALEKGVSVVWNDPAGGAAWMVVPHACIPTAKFVKFGNAGLHMEPIGWLDSNLITTEFGLIPVKVLLTRSLTTDRLFNPFGVTRVEQQAISCSSGENT